MKKWKKFVNWLKYALYWLCGAVNGHKKPVVNNSIDVKLLN